MGKLEDYTRNRMEGLACAYCEANRPGLRSKTAAFCF